MHNKTNNPISNPQSKVQVVIYLTCCKTILLITHIPIYLGENNRITLITTSIVTFTLFLILRNIIIMIFFLLSKSLAAKILHTRWRKEGILDSSPCPNTSNIPTPFYYKICTYETIIDFFEIIFMNFSLHEW